MLPAAIERLILSIRGHRVLMDRDLARLYGVTTKRLNEQVHRQRVRFPADFMFQLTSEETAVAIVRMCSRSMEPPPDKERKPPMGFCLLTWAAVHRMNPIE